MPLQSVRVTATVQLDVGFTVVHQVYSVRYLMVTMLHLVNCTAAPITVQVCVVPSGGTPAQANALMWDFSLPANDLIEIGDGLLMAPGSSLQALASAGASVNLTFSGLEE